MAPSPGACSTGFSRMGGVDFEAISGTSAGRDQRGGAGRRPYARGGARGARERLRLFWDAVSEAAAFSPMQRGPFNASPATGASTLSLGYMFFDAFTRTLSPYDFNPLNSIRCRSIIERTVDFDLVRACQHMKLFISATNVETGRVRVFSGSEPDRRNGDGVSLSARRCSRRWRSMAIIIGTAAIWAIPCCSRSSMPASPTTF